MTFTVKTESARVSARSLWRDNQRGTRPMMRPMTMRTTTISAMRRKRTGGGADDDGGEVEFIVLKMDWLAVACGAGA